MAGDELCPIFVVNIDPDHGAFAEFVRWHAIDLVAGEPAVHFWSCGMPRQVDRDVDRALPGWPRLFPDLPTMSDALGDHVQEADGRLAVIVVAPNLSRLEAALQPDEQGGGFLDFWPKLVNDRVRRQRIWLSAAILSEHNALGAQVNQNDRAEPAARTLLETIAFLRPPNSRRTQPYADEVCVAMRTLIDVARSRISGWNTFRPSAGGPSILWFNSATRAKALGPSRAENFRAYVNELVRSFRRTADVRDEEEEGELERLIDDRLGKIAPADAVAETLVRADEALIGQFPAKARFGRSLSKQLDNAAGNLKAALKLRYNEELRRALRLRRDMDRKASIESQEIERLQPVVADRGLTPEGARRIDRQFEKIQAFHDDWRRQAQSQRRETGREAQHAQLRHLPRLEGELVLEAFDEWHEVDKAIANGKRIATRLPFDLASLLWCLIPSVIMLLVIGARISYHSLVSDGFNDRLGPVAEAFTEGALIGSAGLTFTLACVLACWWKWRRWRREYAHAATAIRSAIARLDHTIADGIEAALRRSRSSIAARLAEILMNRLVDLQEGEGHQSFYAALRHLQIDQLPSGECSRRSEKILQAMREVVETSGTETWLERMGQAWRREAPPPAEIKIAIQSGSLVDAKLIDEGKRREKPVRVPGSWSDQIQLVEVVPLLSSPLIPPSPSNPRSRDERQIG